MLRSRLDKRIECRIGVHLGDVVEESDGDLMGDVRVDIAARLQGVAKPGGICLSEQAYWQVNGGGPRSEGQRSRPRAVEKHRRAYAGLLAGVQRAPSASKAAAPSPTGQRKSLTAPTTRLAFAPLAAGIVALVLLVAASGWYMLGGRLTKTAQAQHLSIVVLPFANLSGDPSQDYFADGVTENLTTELSRIKDSFVIARNTAFTYKGKSVDAKEIGKELGVRYMLEGSVQRDQNRVRSVNAQLVDAGTWRASLGPAVQEEDVADLFKLQDQVVARLANTLGNELTKAEAAKGYSLDQPGCERSRHARVGA